MTSPAACQTQVGVLVIVGVAVGGRAVGEKVKDGIIVAVGVNEGVAKGNIPQETVAMLSANNNRLVGRRKEMCFINYGQNEPALSG